MQCSSYHRPYSACLFISRVIAAKASCCLMSTCPESIRDPFSPVVLAKCQTMEMENDMHQLAYPE